MTAIHDTKVIETC